MNTRLKILFVCLGITFLLFFFYFFLHFKSTTVQAPNPIASSTTTSLSSTVSIPIETTSSSMVSTTVPDESKVLADQKDTDTLTSAFLKNNPIIQNIVFNDHPLDISKENLLEKGNINRDTFAFKFLSALLMLGYSPNRNDINMKHASLLHAFQRQNHFKEENILRKEVVLKLDKLLAEREIVYKTYSSQFPLHGHMKPMHPNDVSADFVATLYMLPIKMLPEYLQLKTEQEFIDCIKGQCLGFLQPAGSHTVDYYSGPISAGSDYVFSGAYFDKDRPIQFQLGSSVVMSTVLHEYGHYLSQTLVDKQGFYAISHETTSTSTQSGCLKHREDNIQDFLTRYGFVSNYNCPADTYRPDEEFADSFSRYVTSGIQFRKAAEENSALAQKYEWLKNNVFQGIEYNTNLIADGESGCYDNSYTAWQKPGYLSCSENYIWNGKINLLH